MQEEKIMESFGYTSTVVLKKTSLNSIFWSTLIKKIVDINQIASSIVYLYNINIEFSQLV